MLEERNQQCKEWEGLLDRRSLGVVGYAPISGGDAAIRPLIIAGYPSAAQPSRSYGDQEPAPTTLRDVSVLPDIPECSNVSGLFLAKSEDRRDAFGNGASFEDRGLPVRFTGDYRSRSRSDKRDNPVKKIVNQCGSMGAKIDVRQPADATETPWEGSVNIPVYQMTFVDEVRKRFGAEEPIVLRGYREDLSVRFAKGKLGKYGFTAVSIAEEGFPAAEEEPGAAASGGFPADPARSRVAWTGRNIASSHFGSIPLVDGTLWVENGRLTGLSLAVDMTKISPARTSRTPKWRKSSRRI